MSKTIKISKSKSEFVEDLRVIRRDEEERQGQKCLMAKAFNEVMDIQEKDKNRSQNDKTEHEKGKSVKEKTSQSQKVKSSQNLNTYAMDGLSFLEGKLEKDELPGPLPAYPRISWSL
ncbi:hypothetical protein Tco_0221181 [Tanacetum coccineum]